MNSTTESENNSNITVAVAAAVEEEVPLCAICREAYDPTNFVVLGSCSHVFHPECINQWLDVAPRQNCPNCQLGNVTAHHMVIEHRINDVTGNQEFVNVSASSDAALPLAWVAYERELHASARNPHERAALEGIFQDIRLLAQSHQQHQNEQVRERAWERIKRFIRCASIAALAALFIYFCWSCWPLAFGVAIMAGQEIIKFLIELKPLIQRMGLKYLPGFVRHALSRMLQISI